MKKLIIILVILLITGNIFYKEYQYSKYNISKETRAWMKFYEKLNDYERQHISYFPEDLAIAIEQGYKYKYIPEGMLDEK